MSGSSVAEHIPATRRYPAEEPEPTEKIYQLEGGEHELTITPERGRPIKATVFLEWPGVFRVKLGPGETCDVKRV